MKILLFAPPQFPLHQVATLLQEDGLTIFQHSLDVNKVLSEKDFDTVVFIFPKRDLIALTEQAHRILAIIGHAKKPILCVPQFSPHDVDWLIENGASKVITPRNWSSSAIAERILAEAILAGGVQPSSYGPIIGATSLLRKLYQDISTLAPLNEPVLILGETGTGKELVAQELHKRSGRPGPFVAINCPEISPDLLASELFGHAQGAFTQARQARKGLLLEAGNGTVLLDEIGDLNLEAQGKLLRLFEERGFRPLGSNQWHQINARILLSTNRDLREATEARTFRHDLYERLNGFTLEVPPLRERRADIPLLVNHFVDQYNNEYKGQQYLIPPGALDYLFDYDWPGNIRELRSAVRKAVAFADNSGLMSAVLLRESTRPRQLRTKITPPLSDPAIDTLYTFLEEAGAVTRRSGKRSLEISAVPHGRLGSFVPLPVWLTSDSPTDEDVVKLVQSIQPALGNQKWRAGILFYRQQPDGLSLIRMAEAQLRNRFITIPIPLAAAERALSSDIGCYGILADYAERYLPGADIFSDRNAISDTATFFGRIDMLHRLEKDLVNYQGVGLFGLRKSGKTSLLLQLVLTLRQHPVIHLDLEHYGGSLRYAARLFNDIIQRLSTLLIVRTKKSIMQFEPFKEDVAGAEVSSEFIKRVKVFAEELQKSGYSLPVICLVDEVERILPSIEDSREKAEEFNAFFGALRVLCQQERRLSLLVADVHPDCNRINNWLQAGVPTNPVFNFFKEIFLTPFAVEDTDQMLISIGRLMGYKEAFDAETLMQIHQVSGGHPFIARQLASFLSQKVQLKEHQTLSWTNAKRYFDRALIYSSTLRSYIGDGIWGDLKKRQFSTAMNILQILAGQTVEEGWMDEASLRAKFGRQFTGNQFFDALHWLEAVGLVERKDITDFDSYRISLPLLSQWLRMNLSVEELHQWQIS